MARVEDMLQKIMRKFDTSDEHAKELRGDLANISQKVDARVVSISILSLQIDQLSNIVNPRQLDTISSNIIQNLKNNGHCMAVTTRGVSKASIHLCCLW